MIKHIKKETLTTANWSGGTTTEIYITPSDGNYKENEFDWRLSTATVEVDCSEFSSLPGVKRAILSLDKPLKLIHDKQYTIELKPFEVDYFEGDWTTRSEGQVTDFNLMTKNGFKGIIGKIHVEQKEKSIDVEVVTGIYAAQEQIEVEVNLISYHLNRGDLLLMDDPLIKFVIIKTEVNHDAVLIKVIKP